MDDITAMYQSAVAAFLTDLLDPSPLDKFSISQPQTLLLQHKTYG